MDSAHYNNKRQKMIASFIVILAVVIVTVGVSAMNNQKSTPATATAATTSTTSATNTTPTTNSANTTSTSSQTASSYKDGSYMANTSYNTPGGQEGISVNLTIQNGAVTAATVQNQSNNYQSQQYQSDFVAQYKTFVVGKKISDINVSGVSGSSLTEEGFNEALAQIQSHAKNA